ncbi:MAG: septum formation protein Maf [Clostridia bacterium]|nr:septum formation protein Maf [Clostridia bacterium]
MEIILASASPRRREILENLGLDFEIVVSNADESCEISDASELVSELSERKAMAVLKMLRDEGRCTDDMLIIGCDSVVVLNGEILGKPRDRAHALYMLRGLSGNSHSVISGLTLLYKGKAYTDFEKTEVYFDTISEDEIKRYVASGESDDKAGGYAIQGKAARFIKGISGCYYNVVGLPVHLMCKMAENNGILLFED